MCNNYENSAKWPILRKSAWAMSAGVRNGLQSEFARSPVRWPVVLQQHGKSHAGLGAWPVAFDAGLSQTLLCS